MNISFAVSKKKCIACGSGQFVSFYENKRHFQLIDGQILEFEQHLEGCYQCGLIRQQENETYSEKNLGKYYAASPRTPLDISKLDKADKRRANALKRLKFIKKQKPKGSLLEVGFGDGVFIHEAHKTYACTGVDPSEGYARGNEYLASKGIIIYNSPLNTFHSKTTFDVVCSFLVLEHIMHPLTFLAQLKKHLKPNGVLIIEAPDIRRYKLFNTESMLTHEHLYHYTIETLALVLSKFGFELIAHSNKDITYGFSMIAAFKLKRKVSLKFRQSGFEHIAVLTEFIEIRERYQVNMTQNLKTIFTNAGATGKTVAVYGTGFLFNFAQERCGLEVSDLTYLYDDTREKAGTKIGPREIYPLSKISEHNPDVVLIFSEMFFDLMKKNVLAAAIHKKPAVVDIHQQSITL
jgi:2-polyprenyl-3-methyl-5-hydroxy-6-metoxy-1,4-benzoquinol methylase